MSRSVEGAAFVKPLLEVVAPAASSSRTAGGIDPIDAKRDDFPFNFYEHPVEGLFIAHTSPWASGRPARAPDAIQRATSSIVVRTPATKKLIPSGLSKIVPRRPRSFVEGQQSVLQRRKVVERSRRLIGGKSLMKDGMRRRIGFEPQSRPSTRRGKSLSLPAAKWNPASGRVLRGERPKRSVVLLFCAPARNPSASPLPEKSGESPIGFFRAALRDRRAF